LNVPGFAVRSQNASIYRFGIYELDLRAAELRKSGMKLKLQDQPYQVLVKLLEHPGEVVSREELHSTLWHEDTFVDFETGLNTAIKRLRETLGDSADNPTFVETVPRRGYKFIAPVGLAVSKDNKTPAPIGRQELTRGKSRLKIGWVAAAVVFLVLISVAVMYRQPRPPTVTNAVRITNDLRAKNPMNLPVFDGLYLYFIEGMPWTTGARITQLSASGGETTWITTSLPEPVAIHGISPDRTELLVANGVGDNDAATELWVQPLPGGTPRRVGNVLASAACWTPDGLHVVYAQGFTIYMANKDGSQPHQLTQVSGVPRALRFSPDGRRIRFYIVQPKAESHTIWEMNADGKDAHPLFPGWKDSPNQCCGNWSPDGKYYYFRAGQGNAQGIWVMPERRSIFRRAAARPSRLTSGPLRFSVPVPSSDGKRLFVMGSEPRVELSRYDLQARRFDPYLPGLSAGPVDFSRDRKWMAYVSYPDMTLWRSRVDGSDKMQLTFPPVRAYEPRWSPDGSKIAFMDVQFNRPWKICLLSSSGGSPEWLVRSSTDEADPTWTPDGESVVYAKSDGTAKVNIAIYRLNLKTREVSSIPDSDGLFSPRVSPDGRYISALTKALTKLMLFDTNTNRWSSLVVGEQIGYNEWSHDGQYVYMRENRAGAGELVRVRMKDRALEHVISLRDLPQLSDIFTAWIGLTPDDAPILMRDRSVQEIYALDLAFH
jgi:Tol biopolymer transport system component/DNA-binding winged helix-turn-helix (wHTH) protein